MPTDPTRSDLRKVLLARREALGPDAHREASARLVAALETDLKRRFGPIGDLSVGAYLPIRGEPDITALFPKVGILSLPQVTAPARPLRFLRYRPGRPLKTEAFGVQVPVAEVEVLPSILLIPCVGYHVRSDGRIDRLGYGGGFYDRTLAAGSYVTVGVAFSTSRIDRFEAEAHDCPLDRIVTDATIEDGA